MITIPRHRLAMAIGLVVLAPTVGEFLLGNVPISQYATVLMLAPLYGGGALLVRESARRLGRGWPTIALFAAAYALVEEGPVDQMVFNPAYLGLDSFDGYAEIPGLCISGSLVLWSLAMHTVWSICVPIALVEAFDPEPSEPWLGKLELALTAVVFTAACVLLGRTQAHKYDFMGSSWQFVACGVAIAVLMAVGVVVRHPLVTPVAGDPPAPLWVALTAFAVTSGYWLCVDLSLEGTAGGWAQPVAFAVAAALSVGLIARWSRRTGWDGRHQVALAGGAIATYALWFGPSQASEAGTHPNEMILGAIVFGTAAFVVVAAAFRRQRRSTPTTT